MNARMISCQVRAYAASRATPLFLVLLQSKGTCQEKKSQSLSKKKDDHKKKSKEDDKVQIKQTSRYKCLGAQFSLLFGQKH
jgi:hypothetical protein